MELSPNRVVSTDLALLLAQGSTCDDAGSHWVVRTPANPTFHWGNCVIVKAHEPAAPLSRWSAVFAAAHPDARHVAIGYEGSVGVLDPDEAAACGVEIERDVALLRTEPVGPVRPVDGVECRPLGDTDDEWAAVVDLETRVYAGDEGYAEFARRRLLSLRALQQAGHGSWWGAFAGGGATMVGALGVFVAGPGTARYQDVMTHPDWRRRGVARTLVQSAGRWAQHHLGVEHLVIVAEAGGAAEAAYRSAGWEVAHVHTALYRSGEGGLTDATP